MSILIRPAVPEDEEAIVRFALALALETEGVSLGPETVREGVHEAVMQPEHGFYLVAVEAGSGAVVGSLMVTYEWSDWHSALYWWIQSVYVEIPWRRRGIFRQLYADIRQRAVAAGNVRSLRLYAEVHNAAALATYARLGMTDPGYVVREDVLRE